MSTAFVVALGVGALFLAISLLFLFFFLGWFFTNRTGSVSPYSGELLRPATSLTFTSFQRVLKFLEQYDEKDNPSLNIHTTSVCPQTGKLLPQTVTGFGVIRYRNSWVKRHFSRTTVPWHRLSPAERESLSRRCNLQTMTLADLASISVDLKGEALLSWKEVPETSLQVLICERLSKEIS